MDVDTSKWSGDGAFTQQLLDHFAGTTIARFVFETLSDAVGSRLQFREQQLSSTRQRAHEELTRNGAWSGAVVSKQRDDARATRGDISGRERGWFPIMLMLVCSSTSGRNESFPYETRGYKLVELRAHLRSSGRTRNTRVLRVARHRDIDASAGLHSATSPTFDGRRPGRPGARGLT